MHRESWKVFLACAIGAGIGSLVALEMRPMFWWIGCVVGFATGYCSYEWRAVLRAVPKAWHAARGYSFPADFWPMFISSTVCIGSICVDLGLGFALAILSLDLVNGTAIVLTTSFLYGMVGMMIGATVVALPVGFIVAHSEDRRGAAWENAAEARRVLRNVFPPILFGWYLPRLVIHVVIKLAEMLYTVVMALPRFARFLRRFAWQLFLRIHSEMRLLCGVDAMLGTIVGFLAGSALIGALVGGAFGVLNYAVVTKRWLEPAGYLTR